QICMAPIGGHELAGGLLLYSLIWMNINQILAMTALAVARATAPTLFHAAVHFAPPRILPIALSWVAVVVVGFPLVVSVGFQQNFFNQLRHWKTWAYVVSDFTCFVGILMLTMLLLDLRAPGAMQILP